MLHRLAWSQLTREKRRLLTALAGVAFAVLLQMMQFGFRDALFASATIVHSRLRADLVMVSPQFEYLLAPGVIPRRRLYQTLALPEVESVVPVDFAVAPFKNPETGQERRIFVIGFDPDQIVLDVPSVIANAKRLKVPDVAIYDALSRPNNFGPIIEDVAKLGTVTTEVAGRRTTIGGLVELGPSFSATGHLIVSDTTFRRMFSRPEGIFEVGLIRLRPGADISAIQRELVHRLPGDVLVLTRQQFVELELAFYDKNAPIGFIFNLGALIGLMVGAVIIYQILYTDITDNLPQYATLKAMGYRDRHLNLVVFEQALMLSVCGFPVGYLLSELLYYVARSATHLPIVMTVERSVMIFLLTVCMAATSCLLAMRKLRRADPAECF